MTSTIALRWLANSLRSDKKSLISFKEKNLPIIQQLAPEYLDLFNSMHPYMTYILIDTIEHWNNQTHIPYSVRGKFIKTKLIECLAFWKGYSETGGEFPLKNTNYKPFNNCKLENSVLTKAHNNIVVIIPIGNINRNIDKILKVTLTSLSTNIKINKIICILDGIESEEFEQFIGMFDKVEIYKSSTNKGPANARNIGITEGLNLGMSDALFLDSDITITDDILDHLLHYYSTSQEGIYCPAIKADGDQWLDLYHNFSGTLNGRYLIDANMERLLFGTTSCMLVPSRIFEDGLRFSGEFTMAAGEDIDFCLQLYQHGYPIYPIDNISVAHWYGNGVDQSNNWSKFKSRFYRYGAGESQIIKRNPHYYMLLSGTTERIVI